MEGTTEVNVCTAVKTGEWTIVEFIAWFNARQSVAWSEGHNKGYDAGYIDGHNAGSSN